MSGIVGLIRFGGREASLADVRSMAARMPHRGPDGVTAWAEGPAALAFLKLAVTPESLRERQPHADAASGIVLVMDGRIDGREDLAHRLGLERAAVRDRDHGPTDVDLLVRAYLKWGREMPEKVHGDYAFAVWDPRDLSLFAARDPFGTRTFYYHHVPGRLFAFASEAKALLALPEVPDRIDEVRLAHHLSSTRTNLVHSIFDAIRVLPASQALHVSASDMRVWPYYELAPATGLGPLTGQEGVEAFRERFEDAVRDRARSAFPVGAQLSGGLDSSSIAVVAREAVADQGLGDLHTFTLTFDATPSTDERPYAEAVLEQGGYIPHYVSADALSPLGNIDEVYSVLDDGLVAGTQHQGWALLLAARDAGVRVVMDGFDGDSVVEHGHMLLRETADAGDWATFAQMARAVTAHYSEADHLQDFEELMTSYEAVFGQFGWPALVNEATYGSRLRFLWSLRRAARDAGVDPVDAFKKLRVRLRRTRAANHAQRATLNTGRPSDSTSFIDRAFAERVGVDPEPELKGFDLGTGRVQPLREAQRDMLATPHFLHANQTPAHLAAALGFDLVHPFFDRRLVELCLALPAEQSFNEGWTRFVLRKSMEDRLPHAVAWRTGKAQMTPAVHRALQVHDREQLQAIAQDPGWLADYIDVSVYRDYVSRLDTITEREHTSLARLSTAILWLNRQWPTGPAGSSVYR